MIKVDAKDGQDQTLFGVFRRGNMPVEVTTQVGGDHPKTEVKQTPPPKNTKSAFATIGRLQIWQDEYIPQ